jgi:hypothetical protein
MNQNEVCPAHKILNIDIPVNNNLKEVEELIKHIENTSFKLLSDITLTGPNQKILIIPLIREVIITTPKKPTQFLDLPVEIRNIIKDFTFNDYKNGGDLKKTFDKEFTNIDNLILLKNMFEEFPKELILNDNPYNINLKKYNSKWTKMKLPEKIKQNIAKILNKNNLLIFKSQYAKLNIRLDVCLYNDLNFDIVLEVNETYTPYIKLDRDKNHYDEERSNATQKNDFYIDKLGCIYDYLDINDDNDDDLKIDNLIGGLKYKDMHDLITYIKTILYNS